MSQDLLRLYLTFYRDLGVRTLVKRIPAAAAQPAAASAAAAGAETAQLPVDAAALQPEPGMPAPTPPAAQSSAPAEVVSESPVMDTNFPVLPSLAPENDSLERIVEDMGDCRRCRLHAGRARIVFGSGNAQAKLVFVGEGPGADEDAQGVPFVGRAGQLLTQMIDNTAAKEGMPERRADVYICNVVKCRPPENRAPEPDEMEICGQFLFRQLSVIKPKAICVLGGTAVKALLGKKEGVTKLRGNWFKWRDIPVMVTYHPSYLLRPYNQNAKREAWEDLKKVLHYVYD